MPIWINLLYIYIYIWYYIITYKIVREKYSFYCRKIKRSTDANQNTMMYDVKFCHRPLANPISSHYFINFIMNYINTVINRAIIVLFFWAQLIEWLNVSLHHSFNGSIRSKNLCIFSLYLYIRNSLAGLVHLFAIPLYQKFISWTCTFLRYTFISETH